jgi:hypothetical protein
MKRIRIGGLCLVAVLAMSAVVVASASAALPEYQTCYKVTKVTVEYTVIKIVKGVEVPVVKERAIDEGRYTESGCKAKAGEPGTYYPGPEGKYELGSLAQAKKVTFRGGGGPVKLVVPGYPKATLECKSSKSQGEYSGTKEEKNVVIEFKGCGIEKIEPHEREKDAHICSSEPAVKTGVIKTNPLKGQLGYLEGKGTKTPTVGILLEPEAGGGYLSEFSCEVVSIRDKGAMIGELTGDINAYSKTSSNIFSKAKTKPEQKWTSFEGGPTETLLTESSQHGGVYEVKDGGLTYGELGTTLTGEALKVVA